MHNLDTYRQAQKNLHVVVDHVTRYEQIEDFRDLRCHPDIVSEISRTRGRLDEREIDCILMQYWQRTDVIPKL